MRLNAHIVFFRGTHFPDVPAEAIDRAATEIVRQLREDFTRRFRVKVGVKVSVPSTSEIGGDRSWGIRYGGGRLWVDVELLAAVSFNKRAYDRQLSGNNEVQDRSLKLLWKFVGIIDEMLPLYLLASNISSPGILRCLGGGVYVEDQPFCSVAEYDNGLIEYLDDSRSLGWPKEIRVSFNRSLKWVRKIVSQNSHAGINKVSRALAAYSHIAISKNNGDSLELLRAMMGLEALYCEGGEGLKKQLFDRAAVLFGPLVENKKTIRSLYDFRSALVHGSTNIPYSFSEDHEIETVEKFHSDMHKSQGIAYLLLIASLQWLVKNDKTDLQFESHLA